MYLLFHLHSMSFAQIFKAYSKVLCLNLLPLCVAFVAFWRKNKKCPGGGLGRGMLGIY